MRDFDEYKKLGEPNKAEKSEIWQTAIGLQQVDGLVPSKYLIDTARENIEGAITIDDVKARLNSYYKAKPAKSDDDLRTEEADKVSAHIAELLSEKAFSFSPTELINIHKRLFCGIYEFAGKIRDYNISKDEWVLDGDTVVYAGADNIQATLNYDFAEEKAFKYNGLDKREKVEHIADFISRIWQIHPFGEGNTRTTAVFAIKYLRSLGFEVTNDLFADNAWYFRNALVRANYNDYDRDVFSTQEFLDKFFGNLLLGENNKLSSREMLIKPDGTNDTVNHKYDTANDTVNQNCDTVKSDAINNAILSQISSNPKITATLLADNLGISLATVKRRLKQLKDANLIERTGSDKTGSWHIIKK